MNLTDPVATLSYHQRRVGVIQWHPTAQNILLSGGEYLYNYLQVLATGT